MFADLFLGKLPTLYNHISWGPSFADCEKSARLATVENKLKFLHLCIAEIYVCWA
jgi:hypothetical protein